MSDTAVHLPGGNLFDDVRLDLPASFAAQDAWLPAVERRSACRSARSNRRRQRAWRVSQRLRLRDLLVNNGVERWWLDEFEGYWRDVVQGRPLTVQDFLQLRFVYRARAQITRRLEWGAPEAHLANWQTPENIAAVFQFVYRQALSPVRNAELLRMLRPRMRVLEYGCSIAPVYASWRRFASHLPVSWVLADIPTFPFHYARHVYAADAEAIFATVDAGRPADPLPSTDGTFDIIVLQEVLEHLDAPAATARWLLDRLKPGGAFFFDYALTKGLGHDTPAAIEARPTALATLAGELTFPFSASELSDRALHLVVGTKL